MTVLERVPVEAITARAHRVQLGRMLLGWLKAAATVFAGLLYLLGLATRKVANGVRAAVAAVVFAAVWLGAAVAEGWTDGARQEHDG